MLLGSSSLLLEMLPVLIVQLVKYLLLLEPLPVIIVWLMSTLKQQDKLPVFLVEMEEPQTP